MNAKKRKSKERRRAQKLADQAWEAAGDDHLELAERLIRRAVAAQPGNPMLWHHQGLLLRMKRSDEEADRAFRTAVSLAPSYAESYAELARLRLEQGLVDEAVALQEQAVRHAPKVHDYAVRLEGYRALQHRPITVDRRPVPTTEPVVQAPARADVLDELDERLAAVDLAQLKQQLTREGVAVIAQLINADACAALRILYDDESLFAKTVVMDRPEFGKGEYRYFRVPIPAAVDQLRRSVYPLVASIANAWQRLLGEPAQFPDQWHIFAARCHKAGQRTPTPILVKYGPCGFNALHRDLRGEVYFPIQMAVVLSPRAGERGAGSEGFHGGDFLLCDVPQRKKSRRCAVAAGMGDAVLFCTRDRLMPVGGVWGLQPVKHGATTITAGTRMVLAVPFHEYR